MTTRSHWPKKLPAALESDEAKWLADWVRLHERRFPQLQSLFKIANEGDGSWQRGARLKAQLLRAGVPDYCLPVPQFLSPIRVQCSNGLFLELKRAKGGKLSPEQKVWAERLTNAGYTVAVCAGWQEAAQALVDYLDLPLRVLEAAREPTATAKERPFSARTQRPAKCLPRIGE